MEPSNQNITNYSQTLCDVMQKEIENLEFVEGVNFEFMDSFEKMVQKTC